MKATLQWLLAHQSEDGSFTEAYLYEGFRNSQLPRPAQKTPLTAQVLVLLSDIANEVENLSKGTGADVFQSAQFQNSHWNVTAAVAVSSNYLVAQLSRLARGFGRSCRSLDVAFAARALHLAGHSGAEAAFEILAKCRVEEADFIFWRDVGEGDGATDAASIRATALALLMYTDRGEMIADKIARWLNQRRLGRPDLPTYSVALEALMAWEEKFPVGGGLQMHISANFGLRERSLTFGEANAAAEVDMGEAYFSHVRLEAKGAGRAQAVLATEYFDSSPLPMGGVTGGAKPLVLDASVSGQEPNSFVVKTCQR